MSLVYEQIIYPNLFDKNLTRINFTYQNYFMRLVRSLFVYKNLPPEIPQGIIETALYYKGSCLFFKLGDTYVITSYVIDGSAYIDIYGYPIEVRPIALYGMNKEYSKRTNGINCVVIDNMEHRIPSQILIQPHMELIEKIWNQKNANLDLSNVQAVMTGDKAITKELRKEWTKVTSSKGGLIITNSQNPSNEMEKFDLGIEYRGKEYWDDFQETKNEILTILGIQTNKQEGKKERLVSSEVEMSQEAFELIIQDMFEKRKEGIKKINELFGLSIAVERKDLSNNEKTEGEVMKDGDPDENNQDLD